MFFEHRSFRDCLSRYGGGKLTTVEVDVIMHELAVALVRGEPAHRGATDAAEMLQLYVDTKSLNVLLNEPVSFPDT